MQVFDQLYLLLREQLPDLELRVDEPMSKHTTFRVGGPAKLMALPICEEQLIAAVGIARRHGIEPLFIGLGSNLLVDDEGLDRFIVKLAPQMNQCRLSGNILTAWAGVPLAQAANFAAENSLSGLEFAHGIPGSLGGAVTMNAGAYDGEMRQVVRSVRALKKDDTIIELPAEECRFAYRHSVFSGGSMLILSATMELRTGDEAVIRGRMAELMAKRMDKQPLEWPSAGSTFKRPEGYFAAALIDQCGLKGYTVGGAQVSEKHAGFVINSGGATCNDIRKLMDDVRARVYEATGVTLEPEVLHLK